MEEHIYIILYKYIQKQMQMALSQYSRENASNSILKLFFSLEENVEVRLVNYYFCTKIQIFK